jgi:uncharacterized protein YjbJ (UPF0337 family)
MGNDYQLVGGARSRFIAARRLRKQTGHHSQHYPVLVGRTLTICQVSLEGAAGIFSATQIQIGVPPMANEKVDDLKGRAKEAAGDLTDNDDLKREGKIDRTAANVKEKVKDAVDKVRDKVEDLTD